MFLSFVVSLTWTILLILAHFQALTVDNFGIFTLFQVLIADNFAIFSTLSGGEIFSLLGIIWLIGVIDTADSVNFFLNF